MPGSGLPAVPGLVARTPGSVVIMIPPVSVCHHVSTIGQRSPPITLWYQSHAFGLIGSPTRAEQPQLGEVVALGVLRAPLDARADRGRRGVEDRHAVARAQLPPDVLVRVVRRALVHDRRRAVGERPVDDVGVPGDPADVGRAPVDVLVGLEVEDRLVGVRDLREVAAGRVQDALRLGGRARRVEDEQRVLGVERLGRALRRPRPPSARGTTTSFVGHRRVGAGVAHDDAAAGRASPRRPAA